MISVCYEKILDDDAMELEQGKIIRIENNKAIVQMKAGSQCHTCGAKTACTVLGGETTRQITISLSNNRENFKEGDNIALSFQPQTRIMSAFLIFILPIILLITGYFLGLKYFESEGKAILSGFLGLIFAFILIWGLNRYLAKEEILIPNIKKIK